MATTAARARRAPGLNDVFTREGCAMAMTAAELIKADQDHLIHPLHHPIDNAEPIIYVRGRGAMVQDIGGHDVGNLLADHRVQVQHAGPRRGGEVAAVPREAAVGVLIMNVGIGGAVPGDAGAGGGEFIDYGDTATAY